MAEEQPEAAAESGKAPTRPPPPYRFLIGVAIVLVVMAIVGNFAFAVLMLFWLGRVFSH